MNPSSDSSEAQAQRDRTRRWLVVGGLVAILLAAMACLVMAAAGIGGLLWLRSARPTVEAPVAAAPGPDARVETALPERAASPNLVNRIAFIDMAGRLGTVSPDGSARRVLSTGGGRYQFPAWAPDSSLIAAVGVEGNEAGLYLWPDEAGAARNSLYTSGERPPFYLYWSPDSSQVSFLASDRSSLGLWLADAQGASGPRQIASGQPFYWDWSQNSEQLFIHTGGAGEDARLALFDVASRQAGDNIARPGLFQAPGISPGGRYLAYAQMDRDGFQVAIEDQTSGRRAAVPHLGLAALSWSPTEQRLAFTSPRDDQMTSAGPLQLVDGETGEAVTLVQDTVFAFFWSPDGRRIAYLTRETGADGPGANGPASLISQPAQRGRVSLRLWVVDVASGQQQLVTTFQPSPVFLSQFLPFFDQYALSHRLWSPASDALVLPMADASGASSIYVVAVESGETTRVAEGTMAFWSWR